VEVTLRGWASIRDIASLLVGANTQTLAVLALLQQILEIVQSHGVNNATDDEEWEDFSDNFLDKHQGEPQKKSHQMTVRSLMRTANIRNRKLPGAQVRLQNYQEG
jgi:hypothetical protein